MSTISRSNGASQIQLRHMPQLAEAIDSEDDWTGITDAAVRRKRQNRLNVRAYRRRKAQEARAPGCEAHAEGTTELRLPCWVEDHQAVEVLLPSAPIKALKAATCPLLPYTRTPTKLHSVILPLSSDHLIVLHQHNVLRGCMTNRRLLSCLMPMSDEWSATDLHILPTLHASSLNALLPQLLHPTLLQLTVPHPGWIDILPYPALRDNLILAHGKFDEDQLWSDTVGGLFDGFPDGEVDQRGAVVWFPPWHFSGWELTEGFCRKWGWALEGCEEVLEATNRWRRVRGEAELIVWAGKRVSTSRAALSTVHRAAMISEALLEP